MESDAHLLYLTKLSGKSIDFYILVGVHLKTIYMLTSPSSNLNSIAGADDILNLSLQDAPRSQITDRTYLGIQLGQWFKWDPHVLNLCKKVASKLSVLNRLRNILPREMLSRQYLSCIHPCIDYAISVWGTCSKQLKDMITRLQHHAIRIVTGIFDIINFPGAILIENLGWLSFDNWRDYFTATMMFKYICIYIYIYMCVCVCVSCGTIQEFFQISRCVL